MTCECCGEELDPFGNDGIDDTGKLFVQYTEPWERRHRLRVEVMVKIKAVCPSCGHIQYGSQPVVGE